MKRKKQIRKVDILIIFIIIVFILVLMALYSVLEERRNNTEFTNTIETEVNVVIDSDTIEKSSEEDELNKIKSMTERNRIEYYISKFIKDVEEEQYEKAYKKLNKEFKQRYYQTIQDFIQFSKTNFSKMVDVEYINFERNGNIYVSILLLTDAINGSKNPEDENYGKKMYFVVKENDFNDFELSFSFINEE